MKVLLGLSPQVQQSPTALPVHWSGQNPGWHGANGCRNCCKYLGWALSHELQVFNCFSCILYVCFRYFQGWYIPGWFARFSEPTRRFILRFWWSQMMNSEAWKWNKRYGPILVQYFFVDTVDAFCLEKVHFKKDTWSCTLNMEHLDAISTVWERLSYNTGLVWGIHWDALASNVAVSGDLQLLLGYPC